MGRHGKGYEDLDDGGAHAPATLAEDEELRETITRRAMAFRSGADVIGLSYTIHTWGEWPGVAARQNI